MLYFVCRASEKLIWFGKKFLIPTVFFHPSGNDSTKKLCQHMHLLCVTPFTPKSIHSKFSFTKECLMYSIQSIVTIYTLYLVLNLVSNLLLITIDQFLILVNPVELNCESIEGMHTYHKYIFSCYPL